MTLAASLNGVQITSLSLTIPYYGAWCADVALVLQEPEPVGQGACTLQIGNLSLVGTAFRAANFSGCRTSRIVGGYGGWRNTVMPRSYRDPSGVKLSMVCSDLAAEVGERIKVDADASLGPFFARMSDVAGSVLRQIAGPVFWIDPGGLTHVGPRPSSTIISDYLVESWMGASGSFEVSTEDVASWLPGSTFSNDTVTSVQTVGLTRITCSNDGISRVHVLSAGEVVGS